MSNVLNRGLCSYYSSGEEFDLPLLPNHCHVFLLYHGWLVGWLVGRLPTCSCQVIPFTDLLGVPTSTHPAPTLGSLPPFSMTLETKQEAVIFVNNILYVRNSLPFCLCFYCALCISSMTKSRFLPSDRYAISSSFFKNLILVLEFSTSFTLRYFIINTSSSNP